MLVRDCLPGAVRAAIFGRRGQKASILVTFWPRDIVAAQQRGASGKVTAKEGGLPKGGGQGAHFGPVEKIEEGMQGE